MRACIILFRHSADTCCAIGESPWVIVASIFPPRHFSSNLKAASHCPLKIKYAFTCVLLSATGVCFIPAWLIFFLPFLLRDLLPGGRPVCQCHLQIASDNCYYALCPPKNPLPTAAPGAPSTPPSKCSATDGPF